MSYEELLAIKAADQKKPTRKMKAPEPDEQDDSPSLDVELPFWNVDFKAYQQQKLPLA